MGNVREYVVALAQYHRDLFIEECSRLTRLVCGCLDALEANPSDSDSIEKMVNAADVIRGGARFLQDADLERSAKILIESFKGAEEVNTRKKEFELVRGMFARIEGKLLAPQYVNNAIS